LTGIAIALLASFGHARSAPPQRAKHTLIDKQGYVSGLQQRLQKGTAWVGNETNSPTLWTKVRLSVEATLGAEWRSGKLRGQKSADAYFVRCDRTTMTQNDINNRRLVCIVGVAQSRPAEFVTFRIRQITRN